MMQQPLYTPDCIVGYSTDRHMLLDLDKIDSFKAVGLARMIQTEKPELGCCLVLQSSLSGYHVVFDEYIGWPAILGLTDLLADLHIVNRQYRTLRHWRGDLTLRISPRYGRRSLSPAPIARQYIHSTIKCCHEHGLRDYLDCLRAFTIHQNKWG